jgi:hypothetical protein
MSSDEGSECCICREAGCDHTTVCRHQFHMGCLNEWVKTSRACPVCRKDVSLPRQFPKDIQGVRILIRGERS